MFTRQIDPNWFKEIFSQDNQLSCFPGSPGYILCIKTNNKKIAILKPVNQQNNKIISNVPKF